MYMPLACNYWCDVMSKFQALAPCIPRGGEEVREWVQKHCVVRELGASPYPYMCEHVHVHVGTLTLRLRLSCT